MIGNDIKGYYKIKYTGTGGSCTITNISDDGKLLSGETSYYAPHNGIVATEYQSSFENIATESTDEEQHGLSAAGGWSNEFTEKVLANPNIADSEYKDDCEKLIKGGYNFYEGTEETEYDKDKGFNVNKDHTKLSEELEAIQKAYSSEVNKELNNGGKDIPKTQGMENGQEINNLWGSQINDMGENDDNLAESDE